MLQGLLPATVILFPLARVIVVVHDHLHGVLLALVLLLLRLLLAQILFLLVLVAVEEGLGVPLLPPGHVRGNAAARGSVAVAVVGAVVVVDDGGVGRGGGGGRCRRRGGGRGRAATGGGELHGLQSGKHGQDWKEDDAKGAR